MASRVIAYPPDRPLGRCVIALGAFDGVHAGHQALLAAAASEAHRRDALMIAVTFDRDPDEILHPEAAAPRLLTPAERFARLMDAGADSVVVVDFTPALAADAPEAFLDRILLACCEPVAVHVGEGFRFGARAAGDLDTLYVWGVEHGIDIRPHELVRMDGSAVSATRIRSLVAQGDVESARRLLGAPHRMSGPVAAGRGHGAVLGFATANLDPDPGHAVPGDGVYAGRGLLEDGSSWPAAISVGTPPSFPEARDFIEAHLLGYHGDLYGARLTLEFFARLRDLRAFASDSELSEAIAHDVATVRDIYEAERVTDALPASDAVLVDDPAALEQATRAVAQLSGEDAYAAFDPSWVPVFGPHRMSTLFADGAVSAAFVTGPLAAAGIPFVWDPFPPGAAQDVRPDLNWLRTFTLLVPPERAAEARSLLPPGTTSD